MAFIGSLSFGNEFSETLSMNGTTFSYERFSLTPALSRKERENNFPMVCAVTMTVVHGLNAALQKTGGFP